MITWVKLQLAKLKLWGVRKLGGEVNVKVVVPVYKREYTQKMYLQDWDEISRLFETCPTFYKYLNKLAAHEEYKLASLDVSEKEDRLRILHGAKLHVLLDLIRLPELAALRVNAMKLKAEQKQELESLTN